MGGCFSKQEVFSGISSENEEGKNKFSYGKEGGTEKEKLGDAITGTNGVPRVMHRGSCSYASLFTQQGRKGVNQDTMTIWEDFCEEKGQIFCGVFDGHGPYGHKVARYVRDALPAKLCSILKSTHDCNNSDNVGTNVDSSDNSGDKSEHNQFISSWKNSLIKAFEDLDQDLKRQTGIDCICSGTTAVCVVKVREHLIVANLGDSRAVLCTRDDRNQLVPVQLSTDHKPDVQSETERIISCNGRAFALEEEPDVHRLWLPEDDSPGLAMSRAFGDFCLKEFGLIATPVISNRILSGKDEFLVLATDGVVLVVGTIPVKAALCNNFPPQFVHPAKIAMFCKIWDVLSNQKVAKIVSSTKRPSDAAKNLVNRAVKAWKHDHPIFQIDDCAVICISLKELSSMNSSAISHGKSFTTSLSSARAEEGDKEEYSALDGVTRANSILKIPRVLSSLSLRKSI